MGVKRLVALAVVSLWACGEEDPTPDLPVNYRDTFTEVRDCRSSGDHDLQRIRVLASPSALDPYRNRLAEFPEGALLVKEEHDFGDADCTGPIIQWTVMRRLAQGKGASTLGWRWQRQNAKGTVTSENGPRCIGCHTTCGVAPDGYEGTCTVP